MLILRQVLTPPTATTSLRRSSSISLASSAPCGTFGLHSPSALHDARTALLDSLTLRSQVRSGIAANTKGTAFVVYEDVMDAKAACDKLNGFNFQNRYLVGMDIALVRLPSISGLTPPSVLYHQPEKMAKAQQDLAERQENLEALKRQHGID